jgi:diguanylate cyclase (GGDEF)-like protein
MRLSAPEKRAIIVRNGHFSPLPHGDGLAACFVGEMRATVHGREGITRRAGAAIRRFVDNGLSFGHVLTPREKQRPVATPEEEVEELNARSCLALALLATLFSLLEMLATYGDLPQEGTSPKISAPVAYTVVFAFNLPCSVYLSYVLASAKEHSRPRQAFLVLMLLADTVLATLTLSSSQQGSGLFFEYALVLLLIYILPIYTPLQILVITATSAATCVVTLLVCRDPMPLQDAYDLAIFYIICGIAARQKWEMHCDNFSYRQKLSLDRERAIDASRTDGLTGLANRTAMREDAPGFLGRDLCVAMLDLDRFKSINDLYGHQAGDKSLSLTARTMRELFNLPNEHCYRYGGDEFLVVSTDTDGEPFQRKLAAMQEALRSRASEREARSVSIGYCTGCPRTMEELHACARIADRRMYDVKIGGGDGISHGAFAPDRPGLPDAGAAEARTCEGAQASA